jgi:hypothetical protein
MVLEAMMLVIALDSPIDAPIGGISPLAWIIVSALVGVITVAVPALWYRGNKIQDKMYEDLKECNEKRARSEEDQLGLLKVLRLQMEQSRGGKKK